MTARDFTILRRGTDSSGRGIYATTYMWDWWQDVLAALPFGDRVVVTQGAFMVRAGGGADDSAGYHDGGGCFDLRVWNLTDDEVARLVREIRRRGGAAWLRNEQHGGFSDPHIHLVLGTDAQLAAGAALQWRQYLAGQDGMGGRDYHWRPNPLVTEPPREETDPMAQYEDQLDAIQQTVERIERRQQRVAEATRERLAALRDKVTGGRVKLREVADELDNIASALDADTEE